MQGIRRRKLPGSRREQQSGSLQTSRKQLVLDGKTKSKQKRNNKIRRSDGLAGRPGKNQQEGQVDQKRTKELGGDSTSFPKVPWSSWPSLWLFPGLPVNPSNLLILDAFEGPFVVNKDILHILLSGRLGRYHEPDGAVKG